jgi:hypothetical protein
MALSQLEAEVLALLNIDGETAELPYGRLRARMTPRDCPCCSWG